MSHGGSERTAHAVGAYNNNYQILHTHDYAMIVSETIHDVRIIPLDGRPLLKGAQFEEREAAAAARKGSR